MRCTVWVVTSLILAFVLGCDSIFDDDEPAPYFLYSCVDREADYACIDPGHYEFVAEMGDGYVMESVALDSQFSMYYGVENSPMVDGYHDYDLADDVDVRSAFSTQVSSGPTFIATLPGLGALVAVNGEHQAVDYMYVSVEAATELRLFRDGEASTGTVSRLSLHEGEEVILRGRLLNGATVLRGTPDYECSQGEDPSDPTWVVVNVNCATPGAIVIEGEAAGTTTLRVSTAGVVQEIAVTVSSGTGTDEPDGGVGDDGGTGTDTAFTDGGIEDGGGTDIQTGTDTGEDTAPLADSGAPDAGGETDTDTGGWVDGGNPDGGPDGGDASVNPDAG